MYVPPIVFLPYVVFSAWFDFWAGALKSEAARHTRDPLAHRGAGNISSAALNAHTGTPPRPKHFSALA
jgi:hypothetical protein